MKKQLHISGPGAAHIDHRMFGARGIQLAPEPSGVGAPNRAPVGMPPGEIPTKLRAYGASRRQPRIRGGQLSPGTPGGRSLDSSKVEAAYVGYRTTFNNRIKAAPSPARKLATVVQTDAVLDRQIWLTGMPKLRRWIGDKWLYKLRGESHPIPVWLHEASIQVPKQDIINDRLGLYTPQINGMADAYEQAISDTFFAALAAGIAGTALGTTYDGQNLVDTDHSALSAVAGTQTNKVTGALTATTFATALTRYMGIVDHNGMPVNAAGRRLNLVVGPANYEAARTIIQPQINASGADNLNEGIANLIVTGYLAARTTQVNGVSVTLTGTEWALIPDDSTAIIIHEKQKPELLSVEEGEFTFRTGNYLYGIEAEFGFAYGMWQEIVGGPGV